MDQAWLARFQAGDKATWDELYRQYADKMHATASGYVGDSSTADDVVAEVFFKAFRRRMAFGGRSNISSWLYRVTCNTALNALRAQKYRPMFGEDPLKSLWYRSLHDRSTLPDRRVEEHQLMLQAVAVIEQLSPKLRVTYELHVHGFTYEEIAAHCGVPLGTVQKRMYMARQRLDELFGEPVHRAA